MNVFVSYSRVDEAFVSRLVGSLRTAGISFWMDQTNITPGDRVTSAIQNGLLHARTLVLVLSPSSVASPWVRQEWETWLAIQVEDERHQREDTPRRIIPVLYQDCDLPPFIKALHYIRIDNESFDDKIRQLIAVITGADSIPSHTNISVDGNALLDCLKDLLPSQFNEVLFRSEVSPSMIPMQTPQVDQALWLVRYMKQQGRLSVLRQLVLTVAPHFSRRMANGQISG